jgi:hypothetical protein
MLALRWNGRKWTVQRIPNLPAGAASGLSAVSCASARACTAVGQRLVQGRRTAHAATLAEHWNGRKWRIQHTRDPRRSLGRSFPGVSCSSARVCTAVGLRTTRSGSVTLVERHT